MAKAPALVLKSLGFPVSAWVRSPKPDAEIPIFHGPDQFEPFLRQTDIAVCLLPLTRETEGILCARTFALMPKGAMVINIGRGRHVVEADLIAALDSGQLSYAALDALYPEPLPPESPLWLHPKVTVMPHVARRPTIRQLVTEIAANIRSIEAGGGLLQEIDKAMGIDRGRRVRQPPAPSPGPRSCASRRHRPTASARRARSAPAPSPPGGDALPA